MSTIAASLRFSGTAATAARSSLLKCRSYDPRAIRIEESPTEVSLRIKADVMLCQGHAPLRIFLQLVLSALLRRDAFYMRCCFRDGLLRTMAILDRRDRRGIDRAL
jgi:hypothetical protein